MKPLAAILVLALAWASPARAADEGSPPPPPARAVVASPCAPCDPCGPWWAPRRWGVQASLAGWLYRTRGDMTVRGVDVEVDQDFDDVLDLVEEDLTGIFQGAFAVRHGRWGLEFRGSWLRLEGETQVLPAGPGGRWEMEQFIGQAHVAYRLGATPLGCDPCSPCAPTLLWDVFAGVRWWDVDASVTGPNGNRLAAGDAWVDPIFGGRVACDFRNGWIVDLEADVGGFGVSSDFTWRVRAGVEWWPVRWFGLGAGWLVIADDYRTGSGPGEFGWDVTLDGPYLALGVRF